MANIFAYGFHKTGSFMPRNKWNGRSKGALNRFKIGVTQASGLNSDNYIFI
jgi:hypothetical protein